MNITNILPLFPTRGVNQQTLPNGVVLVSLPNKNDDNLLPQLVDLYSFRIQAKLALSQYLNEAVPLSDSGLDYQKYFQFPNARIQKLADSIVEPTDTDDQKMYKIKQWVINNIEYVSDLENYGKMEYWELPTETLGRMSADCEGGGFLICSLGLHAGVDPSRILFLGGLVQLEEGSLELGGHGVAVYKRQSDDELIPLDWCYYATDKDFDEMTPLKDDHKYYDDFFWVTLWKTIEAPYANYVRNPQNLNGGGVAYKQAETGRIINIHA